MSASMPGSGRKALIFNDTRVDHHHGCTTVMETITRLCKASGITPLRFVPAHVRWCEVPNLSRSMAQADLVIVNGEGTIHHDRPAGRSLLELAELARGHACSAALINCTWAENSPNLAHMAAGFDLITVRETASQREMAALGVDARVIPDLALYARSSNRLRNGVGVTDNVIASTAVALHKRLTGLGARPISLLHGRRGPLDIVRNLRRYQLDPEAKAHGWGAIVRAAIDDWRLQSDDRDKFLDTLSGLELVVTGRFHALILSLATATPVIAVPSNTHKNAATLSDAGLEAWRAPETVDQIDAALLERAKLWTPQETAALTHWLETSRSAMEKVFVDIAALPLPSKL